MAADGAGDGDGVGQPAGAYCLQGGGEFAPQCRPMDADLLDRAGGGPVVVAALACREGREYAAAVTNGVRYFTALAADRAVPVLAARDHRADPDRALAAVSSARLLVLPGGAPSRIRAALVGTPLGDAVLGVAARGGVVLGASAGAMVLCERMWLPDGGGRVVAGLGAVRGVLVLPHYRGGPPPIDPPDGVDLLGVPECSGVLVAGGVLTPVGAAAAVRIGADGKERPV